MSDLNMDQQGYGEPSRHRLNAEPAFNLMEVFFSLYRWRWFIIIFTILAAVVSVVLASARERDYEATANVFISPLGIQVVERDLNARSESPDVNFALIESQRRVMTSAPVFKLVIDKLEGTDNDLMKDPEFNGEETGVLAEIFRAFGMGEKLGANDTEDIIVSRLRKATATYRAQLSYVIELSVISKDAAKSALLADTIAETYLARENENNSKLAQKASGNLNDQLAKLRDDLREAEEEVEGHKLKNNIVRGPGGLVNELELAQVNRTLVEARDITAAAKITLDTVNRLKSTGAIPQNLPEAIRSTTIATLRSQLSRAKQEKITLSAQYFDTHPIMLAADLGVKEIEKDILAEIERVAEAAEVQYNNAVEQQRELQAKVINLTNKSYSTNDALVTLGDLERDVAAKKVVYEAFLLRAGELAQQVGVDTTKAELIPASKPLKPIGLPGSIVVVAGTAAGFGFACLLVLLGTGVASVGAMAGAGKPVASQPQPMPAIAEASGEAIAPPVKKDKQSGSFFNRLLSTSPRDETKPTTGSSSSVASADAEVGKVTPSITSLRLPVLHKMTIDRGYLVGNKIPQLDASLPGGQIHKLASDIISFSSKKRTRIVLVTGIEDSFGKSIITSNLAYASTLMGERALIVGADEKSADAIADFSETLSAGPRRNVTRGGASDDIRERYTYLPLKHLDRKNSIYADAQLRKLTEQLGGNEQTHRVAFVDGPLLNEKSQIDKIAMLVDEVVVILPAQGATKMKAGYFRKLGKKRDRIRGVITSEYTV